MCVCLANSNCKSWMWLELAWKDIVGAGGRGHLRAHDGDWGSMFAPRFLFCFQTNLFLQLGVGGGFICSRAVRSMQYSDACGQFAPHGDLLKKDKANSGAPPKRSSFLFFNKLKGQPILFTKEN